jgi:ATP-dependent helicase/nuclease subunit B
LEAGSFVPEKVAVENGPRVSLIPLSQVLGRRWDALVLPGCDERHLPWCPPDNSPWTALQRQQLGLPGDEQKSRLQSLAWQQALAVPQLDVLRRKHEQGEECMASPLLRDTLHQLRALKLSLPEEAASPMAWLDIEVPTPEAPLPTWAQAQLQDAGLLKRITPSAYEDLRRCPYRFHARRLLGLSQDDELSEEADKRDWGNWLHRVLHRFHTQRRFDAPVSTQLDEAAAAVEAEMRLDGAAFLPFRMAWPSLREAYAKWLLLRDSAGDEFVRGEVDAKTRLPEADLLLQGRLDRVDRLQDGSTMIIDYKTESSSKTRDRVKEPQEDAQLAFYALLMQAQPSNLRAAYLNLPESGTTERGERGLPEIALHEMPDLQQHAQALREGIVRDVQRIRAGHALAPLGDGAVCDYCEVRGLCRRDYWKGA